MSFRKCDHGEVLQYNECLICISGTYSLELDSILCLVCPSEAECLGGSRIFPRSSYWRSGKYSDNFIQCLRPESCIGHNNYTNYKGECEAGYRSNLC
mmetsp:Transcript_19933/g.3252  ORF Transcript_19933/g.3252 Transcript_19933/m.3252 type:complete len:97 (+) Transcript_19933:269-559(+)